MARTQTIVQLTDELLRELDELRASSGGRSRSDLVREALERYLAEHRATSIDEAIVDGYTRFPPDADPGATWSARVSLQAEPWERI